MPAATRDSWTCIPPSGKTATIALRVDLSPEQLERVSLGHVPEEMEDHWFLFREGDTLFVHRSWTGRWIYSADISGATIRSATVNRNPDEYRITDDEYDARFLEALIRRLLLGEDVPFPTSPLVAALRTPPSFFERVRAAFRRLYQRK